MKKQENEKGIAQEGSIIGPRRIHAPVKDQIYITYTYITPMIRLFYENS